MNKNIIKGNISLSELFGIVKTGTTIKKELNFEIGWISKYGHGSLMKFKEQLLLSAKNAGLTYYEYYHNLVEGTVKYIFYYYRPERIDTVSRNIQEIR